MALEDQNTHFPGFGDEIDVRGSVPILYDSTVTGFRAATTTDYLITLNGVSGNFNLFTGSTSVSNFPAFPTLQAISGIVSSPSVSFIPTGVTITGAGSISNKHYIEFIFSTDFSGSIAGAVFLGVSGTAYSFPLLENATYQSVSYSIGTGSATLISF